MKKVMAANGGLPSLKGIDFFSSLSDADLLALSGKMQRRLYEPGMPVFSEGEVGDELFIVMSGLVAVTIHSNDAEEIELSRVGPGAFFGEMAIIDRSPRSATCRAVEAAECLALKADDFEALLLEHPSAAVGILERMVSIAAGRLLKTGSFLSQMVQWGDAARKRAITDAATGLFNRRYLEDSLEALVARSGREGKPLSFAMFDLDHFGKLNADHGAEFCDRLIVRIADVFRGVFGEEDILVRYGGDEFCFIIPGTAEEAEAKCEGVCWALRSLMIPEKPSLEISCSIGLASFPAFASTAEDLKERADKALYIAKEAGRDRAVAWPDKAIEGPKRDIPGIGRKKRIVSNIAKALDERDSFLIVGHKDPDEDCVSSMVAFGLLANKLNKKASVCLARGVQEHFAYLLNICRYNSIDVFEDGELPPCSALVLVDTPKPAMLDQRERFEALLHDPAILRIELDHHLGADSRYLGQPGYCLVYEASSTCEIIAYLAIKLQNDAGLMARYELDELLSRNLVLAVISGMIGDSQMGRFLKSKRERWFYQRFSSLFERMLVRKTRSGSGNFTSKEQIFDAMASLSVDEDACYAFMRKGARKEGRVSYAFLNAEDSRSLFATYGNDTSITVSKALTDDLAEESGFLGLVGYYDDPALSPFVQFRLRRSQAFDALDLREALAELSMTNGGGHPGAVGFRMEREAVKDIEATGKAFALALEAMIATSLSKAG